MNNQNINQGKVELAKLRQRVSAYIADAVLFGFPAAIILLFFSISLFQSGEYTKDLIEQFASKTNFIITPLLFIYGGLLIGKYGWTLGKRYVNIAVVSAGTFEKVSFLRAFLREGLKIGLNLIPYIGFFVLLINIYLIKSTPKRQAIHDLIARTQVITISGNIKAKKILNIVSVVLLVTFFTAIGILVTQAFKQGAKELGGVIQNETVDWKICKDERNGFEIKYPDINYSKNGECYQVSESPGKMEMKGKKFENIDEYTFSLAILKMPSPYYFIDKKVTFEEFVTKGREIFKSVSIDKLIKEEVILLDNIPATKLSYKMRGFVSKDQLNMFHIYTQKNENMYIINGYINSEKLNTYKPIISQMLTTFRFIE